MNAPDGSRTPFGDVDEGERAIGVVAFCAFLIAIGVQSALDVQSTFESPLLLALLNTTFLFLVPGAVALLAARYYWKNGGTAILLLGCGNVAFGVTCLVAGWVMSAPGAPNPSVTLHNTGALLSAVLHLLGALGFRAQPRPASGTGRRLATVALVYLALCALVALLAYATLRNLIPPFFVAGTGHTLLRQAVLTGALIVFCAAAALFHYHHVRSRTAPAFWYGLGLALIATGLGALLLQPSVGSPMGWTGRSAQYAAGICFLWALRTISAQARQMAARPEDALAQYFSASEVSYRALVESIPDAVIVMDKAGHVRLWNRGAERLFDIPRSQAVGLRIPHLPNVDGFARFVQPLLDRWASDPIDADPVSTELTGAIEMETAGGRVLSVEVSSAMPDRARAADFATIVLRDVSFRHAAEQEIRKLNQELELRVAQRTAELDAANKLLHVEVEKRSHAEEAERSARLLAQNVVDRAPIMITLLDPTTHVLSVNRAFETTTGWTQQDSARGDLGTKCYPDPEVLGQVAGFMTAARTEWREFPMATADGRELRISWSNVRLADGTLVGIGLDLTERLQALEDLRSISREKSIILDHAPIGIAVTVDRELVLVNRKGVPEARASPPQHPDVVRNRRGACQARYRNVSVADARPDL